MKKGVQTTMEILKSKVCPTIVVDTTRFITHFLDISFLYRICLGIGICLYSVVWERGGGGGVVLVVNPPCALAKQRVGVGV